MSYKFYHLIFIGFLWIDVSRADLTLESAIQEALNNDPSIESLTLQTKAYTDQSVAVSQLPDPQVQVGIANLPTDTFQFDQEPMTQFKVGITQKFPAGNTLSIRKDRSLAQASVTTAQIQQRQREITREITLLWLETYYWEQAKIIVNENTSVFKQLIDVVRSLYQVGKKDQHDLIRSELELSQLKNRLIDIKRQIATQRDRLSRWVNTLAYEPLGLSLPVWQLNASLTDKESTENFLIQHPSVVALDHNTSMRKHDIELAKQTYKPNWGVNLSYGYRDGEDMTGRDRPDFLSAMVTFDLPINFANKQDKQVSSATYRHQASISQRLDHLYAMRADLSSLISRAQHYKTSLTFYRTTVLPQASQQATASLSAYKNDTGDFSEVMRATITDLNTQLEVLRIHIDYLQTLARIQYYLVNEVKVEK